MSEMLEKILSDENIKTAYKRVYTNKGAGGIVNIPFYLDTETGQVEHLFR